MKELLLSNIFITLFVFSSTKAQNSSEIIIPMDVSSQRPIVELTIGENGPYKFIFDTGSSNSVIDQELAEELKLRVVGEDPLGAPGSSDTMVSKRVEAPDISFPDTDLSFTTEINTLALRQMVPVDGIINPALFSDYLVTIDYSNSKLILTKGTLNVSNENTIQYLPEARTISLQVDIDGNSIEAHLDSGNPGSFDIPFDLKDQLSFKQDPVEDGVIHTPVAEFKKWRAQLDGNITIGDIVYKDPMVNLVEGFTFINIGNQFLSRFVTTIDHQSHLIQFEYPLNKIELLNSLDTQLSELVGWYGGGVRRILLENEELFLQRGTSPKLKLDLLEADLYRMLFSMPVRNELPDVRIERDENGRVIGITFVYDDGREEFIEKDE